MPIKGLTEIHRLPRLGKLHLGVKSQTAQGAEYPKAVDHFVVSVDESTPAANAQAFKKVYGDTPKALDVMFPSDDPEEFFGQWYKLYGRGTGLQRRCDGEVCVLSSGGELKETACVCKKEGQHERACKAIGNLQFFLPRVDGIGVWQLDTSSFNSLRNLNSWFALLKQLCGKVAGIPFQLILKPQDVQVNGSKKTIYVLDLVNTLRLSDVLARVQHRPIQVPVELPVADDRPEGDIFPEAENAHSHTESAPMPDNGHSEQDILQEWTRRFQGCATLADLQRVAQLMEAEQATLGESIQTLRQIYSQQLKKIQVNGRALIAQTSNGATSKSPNVQ